MNTYLESRQEEFEKIIDFFKKDISGIRTGRASTSILEGVFVEVYGTRMPVNGVANVSVEDSRSITIAPWDKNVIKEIEKALTEAELGVGIANEGEKIRLKIPEMTEEKRKELVKKLNEKMEKARISLRQVRDEIKKEIEEAEKNKDITEDDKYNFIEELDQEVEKKNEQIKEIKEKKEKDIMTV